VNTRESDDGGRGLGGRRNWGRAVAANLRGCVERQDKGVEHKVENKLEICIPNAFSKQE
jgi:hypothetical protein